MWFALLWFELLTIDAGKATKSPTVSPTMRDSLCGSVVVTDKVILQSCQEPEMGAIEAPLFLVSPEIELLQKGGEPPKPPIVFSLPLRGGVDAYLAENHLGPDALGCEWLLGDQWQRRDCAMEREADMVTCSCNHLTQFGIILRSSPLPKSLQYVLLPFYGVAALVLTVQLIRICCAARALRHCSSTPGPILALQHSLMLVVCGLRIWFVLLTKNQRWPSDVIMGLGLLPSLLIEILVMHVVVYWAHILAFPLQKERWRSLRAPFGVLAVFLLFGGAGMIVATHFIDEETGKNTLITVGNFVSAFVAALTLVVVLVSGRGIIHLLDEGTEKATRKRYGLVTVGLCLTLFFQAIAMIVSVEMPDLFVPAAAVFYGWDVLAIAFLALLYARGVTALTKRLEMRPSVQEGGDYKPLKHGARNKQPK